ncbi:hypothetical protein [Kitasatospora sp. NBC_01539]|uniref:hypothetical protein n=1 Tax=Kitasatospora sp. NBC_01539 TaxID=2903577 RepID=UPI0038601F76
MNETETVRTWKKPAAQHGEAADHPAGRVQLGGGGGLSRRADLLSGAGARLRNTTTFTQTMTMTLPLACPAGPESDSRAAR